MEDHNKDLVRVAAEHFAEEIEDASEYAHLAEQFEDEPQLFWELGREEATHANYLHSLLEKHGYNISVEHKEKFHRMMKKYHFER
jgi:hypothetical protein